MDGKRSARREDSLRKIGDRSRRVDQGCGFTDDATYRQNDARKDARNGGGQNHRTSLSDCVMLKDNHIDAAGSVADAIAMAREYASFVRKIEVEVENLDMVKEAVEAGADIIMLDNMDHDTMAQAIEIIDHRAEVEISGNVTAEKIDQFKDLAVDFISSGALTHSSPILDISLKHLKPADGGGHER